MEIDSYSFIIFNGKVKCSLISTIQNPMIFLAINNVNMVNFSQQLPSCNNRHTYCIGTTSATSLTTKGQLYLTAPCFHQAVITPRAQSSTAVTPHPRPSAYAGSP